MLSPLRLEDVERAERRATMQAAVTRYEEATDAYNATARHCEELLRAAAERVYAEVMHCHDVGAVPVVSGRVETISSAADAAWGYGNDPFPTGELPRMRKCQMGGTFLVGPIPTAKGTA